MNSIDLDKLIKDHWDYVHDLLESHNVDPQIVTTIGYHYRSAFRHGFKHAQELYKFGKEE